MDINYADEIGLLKTIRSLCIKRIRQPMTIEQTKSWLKQFDEGPARMLGLLILRHLIFRTSGQLDSSFKQALKAAAMHFIPNGHSKEFIDWRDVLNGRVTGLDFTYGPPKQGASRPGKSGEIISRQLKFCDPLTKFKLRYPDEIRDLQPNQRYLLIDDGTFTGDQLASFLSSPEGNALTTSDRCGIVVGIAHDEAVRSLAEKHARIPLFFGERVTAKECFEEIGNNWVEDGVWPYPSISPIALYYDIVRKARFSDNLPLGYGNLGCLVAYEHGIPDNSLQLLWDKSAAWNPLIPR